VNVLEANRGYLPANWDILWSLSVEEMFYLFFPLVCRLLKPRALFIGFLLVFIALGPFGRTLFAQGNGVWKEYSYLGSMDAIALGCLTAVLVSRVRFSRSVLRTLAVVGGSLVAFILCLSNLASRWGLGRYGLDMTVIAVGACLIMVAAAQTQWKAPSFMRPILGPGERSYEIYLTHMFAIFALFEIFLRAGKPMQAVPILFIAALLTSALLGNLTARFFSEPMNRRLRTGWERESKRLSSTIENPVSEAHDLA
jgi:peptidoglycan/LPS O-acetylase OafA/YrhL